MMLDTVPGGLPSHRCWVCGIILCNEEVVFTYEAGFPSYAHPACT